MLILGLSVAEIRCSDDRASCVLAGTGIAGTGIDGFRIIWISGHGYQPIKFRAITFTKGDAQQGGAMFLSGAAVTLELCVFDRCRGSDGGAIYVYSGGGESLEMYGTTFMGNSGSDSGLTNDISDPSGVAESHATCPSPYEGYTPRQGDALNTNVMNPHPNPGDTFSYFCHEICNVGEQPSAVGVQDASCESCSEGTTSLHVGHFCTTSVTAVSDMYELHNAVGDWGHDGEGSYHHLMHYGFEEALLLGTVTNGDFVIMETGTYTCYWEGFVEEYPHDVDYQACSQVFAYESTPNFGVMRSMLTIDPTRVGGIMCENDDAGCIFEPSMDHRCLSIMFGPISPFLLRSLVFSVGVRGGGPSDYGEGLYMFQSAAEVMYCIFTSNSAGVLIFIDNGSLDVFGTTFSTEGLIRYHIEHQGLEWGSSEVHDSCPDLLSSLGTAVPSGDALIVTGNVQGSAFSNICMCGATYFLNTDTNACEPCAEVCEICPIGKYNDAKDGSQCTICPAGRFNSNTNSTAQSDCENCPVGRYSVEDATVAECTVCNVGRYNPHLGSTLSTACVYCEAGKYGETEGAGTCTFCPSGKANPSATGSSSSSVCSDCVAGKTNSDNFTGCANCTAGKYGPSVGYGCFECGSGKYLGTEGSTAETDCTFCPAGKSSPASGPRSECQACQPGRYAPAEGQGSCSICDPGTACSEEATA
ncbi:hypothetical protein TrRE_jg7742, partial [Triparma retinervis]